MTVIRPRPRSARFQGRPEVSVSETDGSTRAGENVAPRNSVAAAGLSTLIGGLPALSLPPPLQPTSRAAVAARTTARERRKGAMSGTTLEVLSGFIRHRPPARLLPAPW